MTGRTNEQMLRRPLRLLPGVIFVIVQWLLWLVAPIVTPDAAMLSVLGAVACGLAVVVWWLFFSRAPWSERVGAIALMVIAVAATSFFVHPSISNGMMGMMLPMYSIPALSLALVASVVISRHLSTGVRRAVMVASILLACAVFTLIRTGGISGDGDSDLHWRWTPSPEERLLALAADAPPDSNRDTRLDSAPVLPAAPSPGPSLAKPLGSRAPAPAGDEPSAGAADADGVSTGAKTNVNPPVASEATATRAEWPGFRGPARDGVVRGVRIETDWSQKPPVQLWRRPIGPAWSSFAVRGDLIYTQEQRGDDELVSCYRLSTGEPVWAHKNGVRFWESNGGAGPRGTPTLHNGRVYALGATGVLNALDAVNGAVVWSRNAATDTDVTVPDWGVASSPLVIGDLVIVAVSGRLVAYDLHTGEPRWFGPVGGAGYSSPHLVTIDGVAQVVLLRGSRTISVAPADGTVLWEHSSEQPGVSIVQPALAADGDVLISAGDAMGGLGIRRVAVAHQPAGWNVEERWTSRGLKPYFNDFVVHKGHAFGFDGSILAAIDLSDGTRKWKGGRYGHGQLVLLPDQDLLLVLSEDGELALVAATPDKFTELARISAIDGKTWNHPVLVGGVLLVRNGEEMAAFRLSLLGR